ncbi:MAG: virulence RhuM family protein [Candidatus Fermentibacter sp.]|nr:virulence RhuM family protein [Candidatus Fermentibacter sp.]
MTVRSEGSRMVRRPLDYYNLDMIIAVGYRVSISSLPAACGC